MSKIKLVYKIVPILIIVSILFTACDVPDISEFTKQSSEMTSGIRKGVKDTESIIKTATERKDLYPPNTITQLNTDLAKYQDAMKPTLKTLNAIDAYLEALNALAQANKKSGENSKSAVDAVSNLVSAVSGVTFAGQAVNVAAGLLTIVEKFRTEKDFKKRVNLTSEIVEGKRFSNGNKTCPSETKDIITKIAKDQTISKEQKENQIAVFGCGVIDFLKFNIVDLKKINSDISGLMFRDSRDNNKVVLELYDSIVANDKRTQRELKTILRYKDLISEIKQSENNQTNPNTIRDEKVRNRQNLEELFILDGQLKQDIIQAIEPCDNSQDTSCAHMKEFINTSGCIGCEPQLELVLSKMSISQFDKGNSFIEFALDLRASNLFELNQKYLAELERINSSHSIAINEINLIKDRQNQLDKLLDTSMEALDTWIETHANLRLAVNTKKPLTVSSLASKVQEIWAIINPKSK